ncbi:MAG: DinB family protein [Thermoguttaceae bacterium]
MESIMLIDDYLAGPALLRQAVAGMTQEQLVARPVPGKWSTLEVICHLADFEIVGAGQTHRVLARDAIRGGPLTIFRGLAYRKNR